MSPRPADELTVFRLFAESIHLPITPDSIESRPDPEPDIRCLLGESGPACFELVEIIDFDLARIMGNQKKFQARLAAEAKERQLKGFSDAIVTASLSTSRDITQNQQLSGVPELLNVIEQLPDGFTGRIHAGLKGFDLRVTRGAFSEGPVFQVDGGIFVSHPIVERLKEKFAKNYTTDASIELLAYFQAHPTYIAEYKLPEVDEYVRPNLAGSPFSRVWVFDAANRNDVQLLEKTATDAHVKRRGLDGFDTTFHLDARDCYTHGIADGR